MLDRLSYMRFCALALAADFSRAGVQHVFAAIAQIGGWLIRAIGQARANLALTMMAACYDLKRLAHF